MGKIALITGITGQDGSYLAELLLGKGYEVHGIVRRVALEDPIHRLKRINHIKDRITLHPGNIESYSRLLDIVDKVQPDECYHLAAQSFVHESFEDSFSTFMINIEGTLNILNAVQKKAPKCRFYFAGSSEMFGKAREVPQNEKTPFYPRSPYGITKVTGFELTRNFRESYDIFACSGILFNHECVSENTPVIVRSKKTGVISIKRIKDLRRAKEKGANIQQWIPRNIEIWDGDNFVDLMLVTATRREKDYTDFSCRTINTRNGVIETTNHHNMLLDNERKIKAREIKVGKRLLHKPFPKENEISILAKEEALFLGLMAGDGYISEDGKGQFSNNDPEIMNLFEKIWKKIGLGAITKREIKTEYGRSVQAALNGNSHYLRLVRNEIYTYDGFKKVPDRILNADKGAKQAFLSGYNITDGLKSNKCAYEFKNFKTNSIILAQGLLFLINQITQQEVNITFETDEKNYGYYSINLLSPTDNEGKEKKVVELLGSGMNQREICRQSGISRKFIRKIQAGGHGSVHHLTKPKEEVKKIFYHKQQPTWVYDLETNSGEFMAGVGNIVVSNSPRRGREFVTRKITSGIARIKKGRGNVLILGNLDAKRDWGFAGDYVEAMWLILQQDNPEDFVISTGKIHSVRDFLDLAFKYASLDYEIVDLHELSEEEADIKVEELRKEKNKIFVVQHPGFYRPAEVNELLGDSSRAQEKLKWKPKMPFEELVKAMIEKDLEDSI